jgi:hypothetical protein
VQKLADAKKWEWMGFEEKATTSSDEVRKTLRWATGGRKSFGWRMTRSRAQVAGREGTRRDHPSGKLLAKIEGTGGSTCRPQTRQIEGEKVQEEHSQRPQTIADGGRGRSQESRVASCA